MAKVFDKDESLPDDAPQNVLRHALTRTALPAFEANKMAFTELLNTAIQSGILAQDIDIDEAETIIRLFLVADKSRWDQIQKMRMFAHGQREN